MRRNWFRQLVTRTSNVMWVILAGCFLLQDNLPEQMDAGEMSQYRHAIQGHSLLSGTMWDRTEFIIGFPLQLFAISNVLEQEKTSSGLKMPSKNLSRKDKGFQQVLQTAREEHLHMGLSILESPKNPTAAKKKYLQIALSAPDAYMRLAALRTLGNYSFTKEDHKAVAKLLQDDNEFVRLETIRHIANSQGYLSLLHQALQDSSPLIRGETAQFLGNLQSPQSIPLLQNLLRDDEAYVRNQAARALSKLQNQ